MDRAYDVDAAAEALERIAFQRIGNPYAKEHLAEITNEDDWTTKYEPMQGGIPKVWRLVREGASENSSRPSKEEVVLTVQGIIAKKDLPPFQDKMSGASAHAQYLRQNVTLVGLQTPSFSRALENIAEIHALFGRSVGHQNLQECSIISTYRNEQTMEISNRYFTPKKHAGQAEEMTLTQDIDPHDYLKKAAGNVLVHIEDNVVQYFEQVRTRASDDTKFIHTKPIKFQIGDIVEAQISIILVPLREQKFKSTMVLRSLTMMDGSFTQEAAKVRLQIQHPMKETNATSTLKRNVGYADEEFGVTKQKLSRMRVDEDVHDARDGWQ